MVHCQGPRFADMERAQDWPDMNRPIGESRGMSSFEINKIIGAVLAAMTFALGLNILAGEIFKVKPPKQPGFQVAVQAQAAAEAPAAAASAPVDIAAVMAQADATRGQAAFRPCAACHTVEKGGANRIGPNLWNTVAQRKGHADGFNYSSALRQRQAANERWDYEQLYRFLENPRGYMSGTSMSFAGVRRSGERADIIAYLRSLADSPAPLP
jgi:cytochrome c